MTKDLFGVIIILLLLSGVFLFYSIRSLITAINADLFHIIYSVNNPISDQINFFLTNIIFIALFIVSIGLFTLKPMFRKFIIIIIAADIIHSLLFTKFSSENFYSDSLLLFFDVALSVFFMWFFCSKRIKNQFERL